MAYGAPYALTSNGQLAEPARARRADKGAYACLVCGEPVFVRRGEVRAPHFAHYSGHDCDPESVIHEAAKQRLKEALERGLVERVLTPCSMGLEGCERHAPLFLALGAGEVFLEHGFNHRRFDVAVTADNKVMLGLEVFYTHRVDEAKQEDLAHVPWLELGAHDILRDATRWRVLNSNLKAQCPTCLSIEEAERLRERYESKKITFARSESGVVAAEECSLGTAYWCLVCEGKVRSVWLGGQLLLVHTDLPRCEPHAVLVAAALDKLEMLLTAHLAAGEVTFYKMFPCAGALVGPSRRPCAERVGLPIVCRYDAFEVRNDAVILSQDGREVFELTFGERRGGMRGYLLEPGAVARDPLHWPARGTGGVLCGACNEAERLKRA